ncbi:MAG: malonyl-[acyl-carrier protein] O-methyltransferase BioC [Firmicutes bacterium HGW-Firmicutes-1]|jgi:malonyl-CoA O-methyltransferase|nr:MAG: malonyl-[acyl-carrier protein] O-methyltransferase BioC [Firmicutes bacterium HGW-Firmicutes-1]
MIDKKLLKMRFSNNAKTYDQYANIQKKMAEELLSFCNLNVLVHCKINRILDIGCGTGYLTKLLSTLFPAAYITAIDLASGMIEIAKQQCIESSKIEYICGDIEEIELNDTYDLIISNATFQWFNQLPQTLHKLHELLAENGILCFSTFGTQTFTELNQAYTKAKEQLNLVSEASPSQAFYSFTELNQLCLAEAREIDIKESLEYEYFDCTKDFFRSVKKVGANNSNVQGRCQSPMLISEVINIYDSDYRENEKVRATYHCLYLKLVKQQ